MSSCLIGMAACASAYYWARKLTSFGHTVKPMAPQFVKPYVKNGRQLAAWLGLVPKQHATGGKQRLLGISKRGDSDLRTLLIHGARSVMPMAPRRVDANPWLNQVLERRPRNIAAVSLANKNARIAWAVMAQDRDYEPVCAAA